MVSDSGLHHFHGALGSLPRPRLGPALARAARFLPRLHGARTMTAVLFFMAIGLACCVTATVLAVLDAQRSEAGRQGAVDLLARQRDLNVEMGKYVQTLVRKLGDKQ